MALTPEIAAIIDAAASKHGLEPALLRALAWVESRFNPWSLSNKGAMGLLQLMPRTASDLGVTDPYNPRQNAEAGARMLANLIKRFGSVERALWAYNWGPARVESGRTPPGQVRQYATNVLNRMQVELQAAGATEAVAQGVESHPFLSLPCAPRRSRSSDSGDGGDGA